MSNVQEQRDIIRKLQARVGELEAALIQHHHEGYFRSVPETCPTCDSALHPQPTESEDYHEIGCGDAGDANPMCGCS